MVVRIGGEQMYLWRGLPRGLGSQSLLIRRRRYKRAALDQIRKWPELWCTTIKPKTVGKNPFHSGTASASQWTTWRRPCATRRMRRLFEREISREHDGPAAKYERAYRSTGVLRGRFCMVVVQRYDRPEPHAVPVRPDFQTAAKLPYALSHTGHADAQGRAYRAAALATGKDGIPCFL